MSVDQAHRLRELIERKKNLKSTRVVAVTSGKGGVGKSNFTVNFALSLVELGQKVVVVDLDIGMGNVHILLGVSPRYSIVDLLERNLSIWDIIEHGPKGVEFISGGSGFHRVFQMDERDMDRVMTEMEKLHRYADVVLLDLGAGISGESLRFILSADEVVLITTPEPTAITDAYSVLKISHSRDPLIAMKLVVNRAQSSKEGKGVAQKIESVAHHFLNYSLKTFGYVEEDASVREAVKQQLPFCLAFPSSKASKSMRSMAERFVSGKEYPLRTESGMRAFIQKLISFGRK